MEGWKEYKLNEVATLTTGFPFDGHKYGKEGIRVVRGDNVTIGSLRWDTDKDKRWNEPFERASEFSLFADDIVIGMDGSRVGKNRAQVKQEDLPLYIAQRVACIRHNDLSLQSFLYYQIFSQSFENYIKAVHTGTSIPHVSLKQIGDYPILLPSLKAQQRIASILSSLDDKIEVNRRINENLEQQAQALFKSWFVDFEPFRDGEFVESELGMIPKGWKIYSSNELIDSYGGYSYKGAELKESRIAMATIKNFDRKGGFKIDGYKEIQPSPKIKDSQYLSLYDIIIAHTDITQNADIIGNPAIVLSDGGYEKLIMSMDLVKVESRHLAISKGLLYYIFADPRFKEHALGYVNGTTVLHLSKRAIQEYKIALPENMNTLYQYSSILDLYIKMQAENINESRRLAELRDTLLPRLMSGELEVSDVTL